MPRILSCAVLVAALVLSLAPVAGADPSTAELGRQVEEARAAERALRSDLGSAESQLEDLEAELAAVVEDFNVARAELADAEAEVTAAEEDVAVAAEQTASARGAAGRSARSLYTSGLAAGLPELLAGTGGDLSRRLTLIEVARTMRLEAAEEYAADQVRYSASLQRLQAARDEAATRRDRLDELQREVETTVERQRDDIARLEAEVAEQAEVRAERERRFAAARAEQARREAAARAARRRAEAARQEAARQEGAAQAAPAEQAPSRSRSAGSSSAPEPAAPAPSSQSASGAAAIAVQTALAQVGDPYRWAAAGPNAFDCSGLTQFAWKAAGVSLPHSSRMQYSATTRVSLSDIQPGDLVFYYSPISHVGMYIGGGKTVDAPSTGKTVRVRALRTANLVGVGRPRY